MAVYLPAIDQVHATESGEIGIVGTYTHVNDFAKTTNYCSYDPISNVNDCWDETDTTTNSCPVTLHEGTGACGGIAGWTFVSHNSRHFSHRLITTTTTTTTTVPITTTTIYVGSPAQCDWSYGRVTSISGNRERRYVRNNCYSNYYQYRCQSGFGSRTWRTTTAITCTAPSTTTTPAATTTTVPPTTTTAATTTTTVPPTTTTEACVPSWHWKGPVPAYGERYERRWWRDGGVELPT